MLIFETTSTFFFIQEESREELKTSRGQKEFLCWLLIEVWQIPHFLGQNILHEVLSNDDFNSLKCLQKLLISSREIWSSLISKSTFRFHFIFSSIFVSFYLIRLKLSRWTWYFFNTIQQDPWYKNWINKREFRRNSENTKYRISLEVCRR